MSGVVALAPAPASELATALSGAGHDLEADAERARHVLLRLDRPSAAPALLEDVAHWAHRSAAELSERIDRVVRLDLAVGAGPGRAPSGARYLDVRGIADIDDLLLALAGLGVLAAAPRPGDVVTRRGLVAGLDRAVLRRLADQAPHAVGDADGVPAAVRDRANRHRLTAHIERLERRGPHRGEADHRLLTRLRAWRDDPGLTLVKLDVDRGRVVLARGDLDAATHVAAIVPGAGASLGGLAGRHASWMDGLHRELGHRLAADGREGGAATVLWLDYDSPDRLVPDAVRRSAADDAARRLPDFLAGLAGEHRRVTVVGHSYGSVVLGRSLVRARGELAADELIALGSPGLGVQRAGQLELRDDQRLLAGTFDGDPIVHVGRWNPVTGHLGRAIHGPDPRLLAGVRTISLSTHDLDDVEAMERHVQYLEEDSSALRLIAGLAAGSGRRAPE